MLAWLVAALWTLQAVLFYQERNESIPSKKYVSLLVLTVLVELWYLL